MKILGSKLGVKIEMQLLTPMPVGPQEQRNENMNEQTGKAMQKIRIKCGKNIKAWRKL